MRKVKISSRVDNFAMSHECSRGQKPERGGAGGSGGAGCSTKCFKKMYQ